MAAKKRVQRDRLGSRTSLTASIGKSILETLAPSLHKRGVPGARYIVVNTTTGDFVTGRTREEARERFKVMHAGAKGWMQRLGNVVNRAPVMRGAQQDSPEPNVQARVASFVGKTGWRSQPSVRPQPLPPGADQTGAAAISNPLCESDASLDQDPVEEDASEMIDHNVAAPV
jgi:hypothetical protein